MTPEIASNSPVLKAKTGSRKRWRLMVAGSLVAAIFVALAVAYVYPEQALTVDSGSVKADVLVVLGGGSPERPQRAAELFLAGEAPKIILSGFGDSLVNLELLKKNGVPESVIQIEDHSGSTFENAKFSIPLLRQMGARRVIIVTSWYHSRRAMATFEHLAPDLQFYSRPAYLGYERSDFQRKYIQRYFKLEYLKLLGYWLRYGVWPF